MMTAAEQKISDDCFNYEPAYHPKAAALWLLQTGFAPKDCFDARGDLVFIPKGTPEQIAAAAKASRIERAECDCPRCTR
jgi:hypothetical protein